MAEVPGRAVRLAHEIHGAGDTVVLLHGFTQTRASWRSFERDVARDGSVAWRTVSVDMPGHGDSPDGAASLADTADGVARVIDEVGAPAVVVGYSMGARVALHVALHHPGLTRGLVLVSGTAGIDDDAERTARRAADDALADRIESIGTEQFIDEWLAQPMFATLPRESAGVPERLRNTPRGLAESLRHAGTGTQTPLWGELSRLTMPVLVVTGDLDPKFTALGDRLAGAVPHATRAKVPGAGHTVHLEAPLAFADLAREWLSRTFPTPR